jgi:hypothetical protein
VFRPTLSTACFPGFFEVAAAAVRPTGKAEIRGILDHLRPRIEVNGRGRSSPDLPNGGNASSLAAVPAPLVPRTICFKGAPEAFKAAGLVVTDHEAVRRAQSFSA